MTPRPRFESVPEYLSSLTVRQRTALESVIALVRTTVPKATGVISYGIPAFKLDRVFVYCAAFKQHVGIYPPVRGDAALAKALEPYANAKGNLGFAFDAPLPKALIRRVIRNLARRDAETTGARRSKTPGRKRASASTVR